MKIFLSYNNIIGKAFFLSALFLLCACSSQKMISETDVSNQKEKTKVDLTQELSKLPRVYVTGVGRIARVRHRSGCKPAFLLNGQLEQQYAYVYDIVEQSTLKSVRVRELSDSVMFGLRPGGSVLIVIETE